MRGVILRVRGRGRPNRLPTALLWVILLGAATWAAGSGHALAGGPDGDADDAADAAAAADTGDPRAPDPTMPQAPPQTVTVTAETDRAVADPAAFATVIRAADFADRVTTLPDLLRDAVGVQVKSLGGEFATVSIRGSSAEQVVIYLDGVPLNRALGGAVNLATIPLAQIDSIEIYRGITPASLAESSIGGAILLHSRPARPGSGAAASMSYGSYATGEVTASLSHATAEGDWLAAFDTSRSDGDFLFLDNNGTPFDPTDDAWARRVNNAFTRRHALLRGGVQAGPARVTVNADLMARDQGVPGLDAWQSTSSSLSTRRALLSAGAEAPGLAGGRLLLRGSLQHVIDDEACDMAPGDVGLFSRRTDNHMRSTAIESGGTFVLTAHQALSFLGALRRETADLNDRLLDPPDRGTAERRVATITVEDQIDFAAGRVLLNPSLRHETYDTRFAPGPSAGVVPADAPAEGVTTGRVGVVGRVRDGLSLRANAGTFLRLPDLTELYGDQGNIIGNPGLVPERGTNADLGVVAEITRPHGPVRQARAEAVVFATRAEDLILYVPNAQSVVVARNIGAARIHGIELSLAGAAGRWSGTLNAVRQWALDASGRYSDGNLLPGRPRDELSAGAGLAVGRSRFAYDFTYVGANYTDTINSESGRLPARYLHDVSWSVTLAHGMAATLQVRNLFDDHTVDVARFPLPGRSVAGRVSWSY